MKANLSTTPAIFGLRYLEEEAVEIQDVIGCLGVVDTATSSVTQTYCDDSDTAYDVISDSGGPGGPGGPRDPEHQM